MNAKWLTIAASLLRRASEDFANHGCNDWEWPPTWTEEDRRELATAIVSANSGRSPKDFSAENHENVDCLMAGEFGPPDWLLMKFLAHQLELDSD